MASDESSTQARLPSPAAWTLILWFILLVFGGGCLASYYARIGYFPRIAWEESLSYLGVLSIIGGSVVLAFGLLAFLPGVVWCEVLVKDCQLAPFVHYMRANRTPALCVWKLSRIVGIPFGVLVVLMHIAAGADMFMGNHSSYCVAGTMAPAMALSVWIFYVMVSRCTRCHANARAIGMLAPDHFSGRTWLLVAFAASAVPSIVALLILEHYLLPAQDSDVLQHFDVLKMIAMLTICSVVVVAANIVVAISFATRRVWAALVAAVATIFMLVVGESLDGKMSLLTRIMASYGVGESIHYSLVVSSEGREMLEAQGVAVTGLPKGRGLVKNVAILSRLGDEFFFRDDVTDMPSADRVARKIRLPANMVTSWSRKEPDPPPPHSCCVCRPAKQAFGSCPTPLPLPRPDAHRRDL